MPPKKKKPPANPIVVGTVSTRSTRRQSIVNIEIPKSSKASSKYTKNVREPEFEASKQTKKPDTKLSSNDLSQRIKASYNVVINKSAASMPKNDKKFPYKITYTKTTNKEQVKFPPKIEVKHSVKDYSATFKTKGKLKSNKALLQILEDWTDDESDEDRTSDIDSNDDSEHIKNLHLLKIGEAEVNKIIGSVRDDDVTINVQKLVTGSDPSENQSNKQNDNCTINSEPSENCISTDGIKVAEEIKPTDGSSTVDLKTKMETEILESQSCEIIQKNDLDINKMEEVVEECIVENTDGLLLNETEEETVAFDEGDIIVECVTEEIVPEESTEIVLMETSEINTTAVVLEDSQEINLERDVENKSEDNEKEENITFEESSQSVSTCDSNDAEVRSFFAKEIENNEIVNEEDIPTLESENSFDSNKENVDSLQSVLEDNLVTHEVDVQERIINEQIELSEPPVTSEICSENEGDKGYNENSLKDSYGENQNFEVERVLTKEDVKKIILDTNEDSLENKVAELHLIEKDVKTDDVSKIIAELKIKDEENLLEKEDDVLNNEMKDEDVSMKSVPELQLYLKVERDKLEEIQEDLSGSAEELLEKSKTPRRTRLTKQNNLKQKQNKNQLNETKSTKQAKSVKAIKEKKLSKNKENNTKETKPSKETKLKDGKSKKKITPTENIKKFKDKIDKKETTRKSSKLLVDQAKKSKSDTDYEDTEVRRSSRIKSISVLKKKTTGHGLVRSKSEPILNESDVSDSNSVQTESEKSTPSASPKVVGRERKSRWTRSSENLSDSQSTSDLILKNEHLSEETNMDVENKPKLPAKDPVVEARLKQFVHLKENLYKTDRMTCKEAKKMTCDCFLTLEEIDANEYGCGEDCLNRLLLIECGNLCQVGDRCTNKRFQKGQFAPIEVFNTEKKGLGLRAAANIPYGEFILEYVGEVLNCDEFDKRAEVYSQDKNIHYYFMSLRADAVIDATMKGNISRFINHSCDPNAETQKWTVNGELRIGFFSTRTILAGEEITFDYRFQRYGKEAQKCYCEASNCRGWLGEQPDEDSEDDEEEEEEEEETETVTVAEKVEIPTPEVVEPKKVEDLQKPTEIVEITKLEVKVEKETEKVTPSKPAVTIKRKSPRKKPRKEIFEDIDQLDEDIEMLVTTGLKNQAHTLKLSRLMVRAKEPTQRHKLLRILRRGELPCRRLFLDYHGLRLMHGYMIDAQHLVHANKKYESLRLEVLQTLAVLPIPNKTMLQDSKVLPTVEKWAVNDLGSPLDSDSNSPENEQEQAKPPKDSKEETKDSSKANEQNKDEKPERSIEDQEEEIKFLATKLLEEWANLKEVFRIPKKERIEQMKEHEREANKKFMQSGYGNETPDSGRKSDRYRHLSRYKLERETSKKGSKSGGKPSAEFIRLSKIERRKLFALQHELKEEERRLKQREMWRQHELNCLLIGTDPRFTAPFDPSRGYQCIWNPQIGQWQNYPLPPQNQTLFPSQPSTPNPLSLPLPNLSMPPPQLQIPKSIPNFPYTPQIGITTSLNAGISNIPIPTSMNTGISHSANMGIPQPPTIGIPASLNGTIAQLSTSIGMAVQPQPPPPSSVSQMHVSQQLSNLPSSVPQMNAMQGIPGALPQNIPTHAQIPVSMQSAHIPISQYQEPVKKEEDPSQVKFMGPIPPPARLPPKWKCAKDKYGRPYYYHVKMRKSQWEPPPFVEKNEEPEEVSETESSSDTSTVSSDTSSENSDSDDEIDDTKLLIEVRKQMEKSTKLSSIVPDISKTEEAEISSPEFKNSDDDAEIDEELNLTSSFIDDDIERPSIDKRLKEQFDLLKDDKPPRKRRRLGLCEEILISPRTEEDKLQFKEDLKRYKANKEKLKRQKELILQQTRKQLREVEMKKSKEKRQRTSVKTRIKEMPDFNTENARKIKESFRANMASTVVGALNNYRKPDCKEGRITNTDDFKHLARKLTHFVMLKEMKHIARIDDLTCTDNVKSKAREYIKKYMSKFGEVYIKRNDSPDFKD